MKGRDPILVPFVVLFLSLFLSQNLPAGGQLSVDSEQWSVNNNQSGRDEPQYRILDNRASQGDPQSVITNPQLAKAEFAQKTMKLQIPFIANNGQADDRVRFYANTFGGTVFVTKNGEIVYALPKTEKAEDGRPESDVRSQNTEGSRKNAEYGIQGYRGELHSPNGVSLLERGDKGVCNTIPIHNDRDEIPPRPLLSEGRSGVTLKEQFVGAKTRTIQGEEKSVTKVNYFKGNDPSKWKSNISTYGMVNLGEIYKGIELKLKAYGNNIEKLFCVKPDANPNQIQVNLSGAKGLRVNDEGQLVAETELGAVKFTKPVAYQEINGKRVDVSVEYRIQKSELNPKSAIQNFEAEVSNPKSKIANRKLEYGFRVASFDKSHDLIIDPLLASTFLGGSFPDSGKSMVIDSDGNIYVAGYTGSSGFPTTEGAYDTSYNNNGDVFGDVFVSKLNENLTNLLASTYLGGSKTDYGFSMAIDSSGNIYVTGYTGSSDFPTTTSVYNTSYNGDGDVFISKLDGNLTNLLASTYLGGSKTDYGYSMAIDSSGNIYVTGYTTSGFPTTEGAYDTSYNDNNGVDVFVSKLNGNLTNLLASTYLGGSSYDYGQYITLDTRGNVYVTGETYSSDFPTTSGAYDTSFNGGTDVFVSKLDGGLTSLFASTLLGGSGVYSDSGYSIAIDSDENIIVAGYTSSSDFPTTADAYDTSYNGVYVYNTYERYGYDAFVSKLDGNLTSLLASTYLGGSSDDYACSITIDSFGNIYMAGITNSLDFPTTTNAYDTSLEDNTYDVFVLKIKGDLTSLLASTYLGGFASEYYYTTLRPATALAIDLDGDIYVAGETGSHDFPITDGAYDTSNGGYNDAFISKFDANLSSNKCKINGHVLGNKGNPIEYSKIKLKGTNVLKKTISDEDGLFEFLDLNAGTYVIMATKKGYKRYKQTISLEEGEQKEIEIEMKKTSKRVIDERQTTEDTDGTDKN